MASYIEEKGFDLSLDCIVCRENKKTRHPRVLSCRHSFCFECLPRIKQLGICQEEEIKCPICWKSTKVTTHDGKDLPVDDLVEKYEKMLLMGRDLRLCQGCQTQGLVNQAIVKCCTCERRLCQECLAFHKETPIFSKHTIVEELCKVHLGVLTHVCFTCCRGICTDCLLCKVHQGHDMSDIADSRKKTSIMLADTKRFLEEGTKELNSYIAFSISEMSERFAKHEKPRSDKIQSEKIRLEQAIETCMENYSNMYQKAVEHSHNVHRQALLKASNDINEINALSEEDDAVALGRLTSITVETFKALSDLRNALQSPAVGPDLLQELCEATVDQAKGTFIFKFTLCTNVQDYHFGPDLQILDQKPKKQDLPELDIKSPRNLAILADESCIVANTTFNYCTRIYTEGRVVAKLFTSDGAKACSVATYKEQIYIASKGGRIVTVVDGAKISTINLQPPVQDLQEIGTDGTALLFVNRKGLLKYSIHGELQKELSTGTFGRLTVAYNGRECRYIVSDSAEKKLYMYNTDGRIIKCISNTGNNDTFGSVDGSTVLPNGNILVADHDRSVICEFNSNGSFVRYLLTRADVSYPRSLRFSYPYLWLSRSSGSPLLYKYEL